MCALVYAATVAHQNLSVDVVASNFGSWHLAQTGTAWLDHARIPARIADNPARDTWVLLVDGHPVIGRSPGTVAASLPAYWLFGGSGFSQSPAAYTAALITAAAVMLLFLALRRALPVSTALVATGVLGFATPVWSVAADGMFPHTLTVLGICGMAWAAASGRWWLVGIFGGVALWGRVVAALIVAIFGLHLALRRREPGIALRVGAGSAVALVLLSIWIHWMYGTWRPTGSYDSSILEAHAAENVASLSNQLGIWISPGRGILVWTPVVLVLLPALVRSWPTLPDWSRSLLWAGLVYTVFHAMVNPFGGGTGFYGYRYGLEFIACATPALSLAAPRLGRIGRVVIGPVIGVQLFAIALGAVSERHGPSTPDLWRSNFFVSRLDQLGAPGWTLLVVSAVVGLATVEAMTRFSLAQGPSAGRPSTHRLSPLAATPTEAVGEVVCRVKDS